MDGIPNTQIDLVYSLVHFLVLRTQFLVLTKKRVVRVAEPRNCGISFLRRVNLQSMMVGPTLVVPIDYPSGVEDTAVTRYIRTVLDLMNSSGGGEGG